jgi:DNA-binding response OmpR family regulator
MMDTLETVERQDPTNRQDTAMMQSELHQPPLPHGLRVLVVEDDPVSLDALRQGLADCGAVVNVARDGVEAIRLASEQPPEMVVLDLLLPLLDGEHVIDHLKRAGRPPIVVVSAKRSEESRVYALDLGADDYLTKPFTLTELTARMRAVLRRAAACLKPSDDTDLLDIQLEPAALAAIRGGERLHLTAQEFALLDLLVRERGKIVSREAIHAAVLPQGRNDSSNVVDVVVMRLRKKLGSDLITTRRGQGFMIDR